MKVFDKIIKILVASLMFVQVLCFISSTPYISKVHAEQSSTTAPVGPTIAAPMTKGTWIWYTADAFKNMDVTFNQIQLNGINLVYLQQDVDLSIDKYAVFIKRANSLGVEVHALAGEPNWVLPDKQIKMYKFIDWVRNYNLSVQSDERFKGIHLDIEPFTTKEWQQDEDKIIGYWRDTVTGFVQETKTQTGLQTGADIPFWLHKFNVPNGHGGRITLSAFMISQFDITTLMAYRDNTTEIMDLASNALKEAENMGKHLLLSVETLKNPDSFVTFYGKGRNKLNKEMGDLSERLKNLKSYKGYAVHEFNSWNQL